VPDFSWIIEINESAWMPALLGKSSVNVGAQQLRQLSDVPADMPLDDMLRAFDAWSHQQFHEYHLMFQPGDSWLLTREQRARR
jgi:hypothetical protein